ncbi:MAG: hypothetical protein R6X08_01245 [Desulfosalsimonadaceae bacterium]
MQIGNRFYMRMLFASFKISKAAGQMKVLSGHGLSSRIPTGQIGYASAGVDPAVSFYPQTEDLIQSTTAARFNGYLAGYGDCEQLKCEVRWLGLTPKSGTLHYTFPAISFIFAPIFAKYCPARQSSYALHSGAMPANQI